VWARGVDRESMPGNDKEGIEQLLLRMAGMGPLRSNHRRPVCIQLVNSERAPFTGSGTDDETAVAAFLDLLHKYGMSRGP